MARPMTLEQLQEALRNAARPDQNDPGFRVDEISAATGLSGARVHKMIAEGLANGTVVRSKRVVESIRGHQMPVTTYVFLDPSPAKKARRA